MRAAGLAVLCLTQASAYAQSPPSNPTGQTEPRPGSKCVCHNPSLTVGALVGGPSRSTSMSHTPQQIGLAGSQRSSVYLQFRWERLMTARDDFDPLAPQREAAFFYGLFLRGHDVDTLRQDIDVPHPTIEKWMKARDFEASFRDDLRRVCAYRKQVLAIFDGLILNEQNGARLQ